VHNKEWRKEKEQKKKSASGLTSLQREVSEGEVNNSVGKEITKKSWAGSGDGEHFAGALAYRA
jgi:hypothetical protein